MSSSVDSGNQTQAPPDTVKQTLSSQCLSRDKFIQPHLHTSRNEELTTYRAEPLEGSVVSSFSLQLLLSVLCSQHLMTGLEPLAQWLSSDCLAHVRPPAPSNQPHFQLCLHDCSSKRCPNPYPRVQPAVWSCKVS